MGLKGHTKIELTDVNTGEVQIIEDNNFMTRGLEHLFNPMGVWGNQLLHEADRDKYSYCLVPLSNKYQQTPSSTNKSPDHLSLLKSSTGGLLLYDKRLPEDINITMTPAGYEMTGHGSFRNSSTNDITMGLFNTSESKELYNGYGYKYVWDFNTNQANGDIGAVCLTTAAGGTIGTGCYDQSNVGFSKHTTDNRTYETHYESQQIFRLTNALGLYDIPIAINATKNEMILIKDAIAPYYSTSHPNAKVYLPPYNGSAGTLTQEKLNNSILNTHKLVLEIRRCPYNNLSIFDYAHFKNQAHFATLKTVEIELKELEDIITSEMTTIYSSWGNYKFYYDVFIEGNYLYFFMKIMNTTANEEFTYYDAPGAVIGHIWKINLDTYTIEKYYAPKNLTTEQILTFSNVGYTSVSNTQDSLMRSSLTHADIRNFIIIDGYLFCHIGNSTKHSYGLINLEDNSNYHFITDKNKERWYKTTSANHNLSLGLFTVANGKIYHCPMNQYYGYLNEMMYIIDTKTYTRERLNITISNFIHYSNIDTYGDKQEYNDWYAGAGIKGGRFIPILGLDDKYLFGLTCGNDYTNKGDNDTNGRAHDYIKIKLMHFPTTLVTINNLEEILTKTESQTMKITYTLVDEDYYNNNLKTT